MAHIVIEPLDVDDEHLVLLASSSSDEPPTFRRRPPPSDGAAAPPSSPRNNDAESEEDDLAFGHEAIVDLLRRWQHFAPFVALLALRFLYEHALSGLCLVVATSVLSALDGKFRSEAAVKGAASKRALALVVVGACGTVAGISRALLSVQLGAHLDWGRLVLNPGSAPLVPAILNAAVGADNLGSGPATPLPLMGVLWVVAITDVQVRIVVVAFKASVALLPLPRPLLGPLFSATGPRTTARRSTVWARKRQLFTLLELGSLLYRTALPTPFWLAWYAPTGAFAWLYLALKLGVVSARVRLLFRASAAFARCSLEHGKWLSHAAYCELGSPDCPVCLDTISASDAPVVLPCNHVFCEACLGEWLDKEPTCPICRAQVDSGVDVPRELRQGMSPLLPQIL